MHSPANFVLLPSQQQLLDRLRYLVEYAGQLLLLHGPNGAGKTTIIQSLMAKSECFNQAYVVASEITNPAWLKTELVTQLKASAVFDAHLLLADTLARILDGDPMRVLVIVDNAHLLSGNLLAELFFVADDPRLPQLTLLLSSDTELHSRFKRELPESYLERLLAIEVPALSLQEQQQLLARLTQVAGLRPMVNPDAMQQRLQHSRGMVGDIVALSKPPVPQKSPPRSTWKPYLPFAMAALCGLIVLVGGVYWLSYSFKGVNPEATEAEIVTVRAAAPVDESWFEQLEAAATAVVETDEEKMALVGQWQSTTSADWPYETVLDEMGGMAEQVIEPETLQGVDLDSSASTLTVPAITPDNVATDVTVEQPTLATVAEILERPSFSTYPLAERPASSFLLQFGVYSNPASLRQFVEEYQLKSDKFRIYLNHHQPKPWWFLVFDGHADRAGATEAIKRLPDALQQLEPYVKPLETVQKELASEQTLAEFMQSAQ